MKVFASFASGGLRVVDAAFEASASVWRVLWRSAFTPDGASYRGGRFVALASQDVLVSEIELNVGDREQALKTIALEPERHLPLSPELIAFDVVGPIDGRELRNRPERRFILGVAKRDRLQAARESVPRGRRAEIEGFTYALPALPSATFLYTDDTSSRRRRLRRASLLIALVALFASSAELWESAQNVHERTIVEIDAQRVQAERRVRQLEHRLADTRRALTAASTESAPTLSDISETLARLAARIPSDGEINLIETGRNNISISGATYDPDGFELALRRGFENAPINFTAESDALPAPFSAQIRMDAARNPPRPASPSGAAP